MYKNGRLCGCTDKGYRVSLTDDSDGNGVAACNTDNDCTYSVSGGFGGTCGGVCVGSVPDNSELCAVKVLTSNVTIKLVPTCGAGRCEYKCKSGFHYE